MGSKFHHHHFQFSQIVVVVLIQHFFHNFLIFFGRFFRETVTHLVSRQQQVRFWRLSSLGCPPLASVGTLRAHGFCRKATERKKRFQYYSYSSAFFLLMLMATTTTVAFLVASFESFQQYTSQTEHFESTVRI